MLLLILTLCLVGCGDSGPPTGTVEGTITLDGKPYTGASIIVFSIDTGAGSNANLTADGGFKLEDPIPVGSYVAYLAPAYDDTETEAKPVVIDNTVPSKYWNESETDLKVEVKEGENKVTLAMTK
ncbi:MAG: hypothetical protein COA78_02665 [Blastopirellula sp.]|nr:MAG: hypothetical protein COA78_02665 [Blastopirellula sp.]